MLSSLRGELADLLARERVGMTYRPGDTEALVSLLTYFQEHPAERRDMGYRGRDLVRDHFSSLTIYRDMAMHIERVAHSYSANAFSRGD